MTRIQYIPNRVIDSNGISDGAQVFVYQSGTTTKVPLFGESTLTVAITNPISVPAGAEIPIFFTSYTGDLRLRVVESDGTISQDQDPYSGPASLIELSDAKEELQADIGETNTKVEIVRDRIPTFNDEGAKGNGLDDDTAKILTALENYPVITGEPGSVYRINNTTPIPIERFRRIQGIGGPSEAVTNDAGQSGFKLWFDGSGPACFANADPTMLLSHGGFKDFNIHVTGNYDWVFDFRSAVEIIWDTMQIEVTGMNTGIIRSRKINPDDPSWIQRLINCQLRVPDLSTAYVLDHDWSDSPIIGSHFTGGKGVIDRGFGARYTSSQFERSSRAGLTVLKATGTKGGSAVGCAFDANAVCGVEVDVTGDLTTGRYIGFQLVGNTFRTVSEFTGTEGTPGTAQIIYTNPSAFTYEMSAQRDSAFLDPRTIPAQSLTGLWDLKTDFHGNLTPHLVGTPVIDANGVVYPNGGPAWVRQGSGSPEGVIAAGRGSVWIQIDAADGSGNLWSKRSNTSSTGWVLLT